jgi:hypothetical protein
MLVVVFKGAVGDIFQLFRIQFHGFIQLK